MTEQELKQKFEMFTEAWKFYRKWAVVPLPITDKQWEQIVAEAHEFRDKYGGTKAAECLMIAVTSDLNELERRTRK